MVVVLVVVSMSDRRELFSMFYEQSEDRKLFATSNLTLITLPPMDLWSLRQHNYTKSPLPTDPR